MGSVSVYTGVLDKTQVDSIIEGRVVARLNGQDIELPQAIRVFANNNKDSRSVGFVINMENASMEERRKFLSAWNGKNTDRRNAQGSYNSVYEKSIKAGETEEQARKNAEEARTRTTHEAMNRVLNDKEGKANFPNIRVQTINEYQTEDKRNKATKSRRSR